MSVKRSTPGMQQGAKVRVAAKKPVCPHHEIAMSYDPEDMRWHCTWPGCPIESYQRGDHVQSTARKYEGPVSLVVDKRDGKVWLRLAPSTFVGDATMVLLSHDYTGPHMTVEGVSSVDCMRNGNLAGQQEAQVVYDDVVGIDHSGRLRR